MWSPGDGTVKQVFQHPNATSRDRLLSELGLMDKKKAKVEVKALTQGLPWNKVLMVFTSCKDCDKLGWKLGSWRPQFVERRGERQRSFSVNPGVVPGDEYGRGTNRSCTWLWRWCPECPLWHQAPVRRSPSFSSLRLDTANQPQIIPLWQLHSLSLSASIPKARKYLQKWRSPHFFGLKGNLAATKELLLSLIALITHEAPEPDFAILPVAKLAQIPPFALSARLMPFSPL